MAFFRLFRSVLPRTAWREFSCFHWVFAVFLSLFQVEAAEDSVSFGPLFESFPLTLHLGERTEAVGPFFYSENRGAQQIWSLPPLLSSVSGGDADWSEFDFLYPVLTYDRFGTEYRFQILQLFSFSGGALQSGQTKDRFTLFPLYFQQRSADSNENYTAFFPLYGKLRNRLFRDEIDFVLWPLYVKTVRRPGVGSVGADEFLPLRSRWAKSRCGDVTTYNFMAPMFHLRYGDGLRGWQFWPLAGHERKEVTVRTNSWGDAETVAGFEKSFVLWPLWLTETHNIGTTNTSYFKALLPFYSSLRSPERDSTSFLWPIGLTLTDDRARKYLETDVLWPVFAYARGEGKETTRFWPLFGISHNDVMESNFYLWPIYRFSRVHSDPLDRSRTQILFFLYSDVLERDTASLTESRRVDCWPLFTKTRDREGNIRLQVLSIIEPILSKSKSVDRNYSHLWSLWRSERNSLSGAASQSLLWNLYRHQTTPNGNRKTSLLFGLFQHQSSPAGSGLRLFFIPLKRLPEQDAAATVDSELLLEHSAAGGKP
jgi:hypothetical protein